MKTKSIKQVYWLVLSLASLTLSFSAIQAQKWTEVSIDNNPSMRWGHAMAYDSVREVVVLHGGGVKRDTWEWDGKVWKHVSDEGPAGSGFGIAFDEARGVVVLDGGFSELNSSPGMTDTWEWDGETWKKVASGGKIRGAMAMVYHPGRGTLIRHGGHSHWSNPEEQEIYSDTWEWNGDVWTEIQEAGGPARKWHQLVYDSVRNEVVTFGGGHLPTGDSATNDTWTFAAGLWRRLDGVTGPPSRRGYAMVFDRSRGVTILFGGGTSESQFNDTWEWDGTQWEEITLRDANPPARWTLGAVFNGLNNQMMIYGGLQEGALSDQWQYESGSLLRIGHVVAWQAVSGAQDLVLEYAEDPDGPWLEYEAERSTIGDEVVVPISAIDRSKFFRTRQP